MLEQKIHILFQNIWFFIFWQNSFTLLQRKGEQENVRFIINEDTVLNIIPLIMYKSDCQQYL
jgi:hypothetical protein